MKSKFVGYRCAPIFGDSKNVSLPFCKGGAHPGRWIKLPRSVEEKCNVTQLVPLLVELTQKQWLPSGRQDKRVKNEMNNIIANYYQKHASGTNFTEVWKTVLEKPSPPLQQWTEDYTIYMSELARYANGPICLLSYVEVEAMLYYDNRLSLFAPYECKYKLFSIDQLMK